MYFKDLIFKIIIFVLFIFLFIIDSFIPLKISQYMNPEHFCKTKQIDIALNLSLWYSRGWSLDGRNAHSIQHHI